MSDLHFMDGSKATMTSASYTRLVESIEVEIKRVKAENNPENKARLSALKKEKRALKNKASAMRCREKKRRKMTELEHTVLELQRRVAQLEQENRQLRSVAKAAGAPAVPESTPAAAASAPPAPVQAAPQRQKQAPEKHRIHYTAPSKRRQSPDVIIPAERPRHEVVQKSVDLEKPTKMTHSRAHAVSAPVECQVSWTPEGFESRTPTMILAT